MKVELRMIHYTTIVLPGKPLTNGLKWPPHGVFWKPYLKLFGVFVYKSTVTNFCECVSYEILKQSRCFE